MANGYNPPTRTHCETCERLKVTDSRVPIINANRGKSSSTNGFPFHGWYNFVLGYAPIFPQYLIDKEKIGSDYVILDPFAGSGTTQLVCKLNCIPSIGIDANDYMIYAAKMKLKWNYELEELQKQMLNLITLTELELKKINWLDEEEIHEMAEKLRPKDMEERYISDNSIIVVYIIKKMIMWCIPEDNKQFFTFALSTILVPVSNISYGPGFGVSKKKKNINVLDTYSKKLKSMISDLEKVNRKQIETQSQSILGDSREASRYVEKNTISFIITSPPYPGDHEYTKHSKLELIFEGMARDIKEFRVIKKRMLRSSTTNIYKEDCESTLISSFNSIRQVTDEIDRRLKEDGGTSGFEKLYSRLVCEYFGGMYKALSELFEVLKPGGKIALLVSDSHAFKMVHIETAAILEEIGKKIGFTNTIIELWQMKSSTSHSYEIRENILIMEKPHS